MRSCQARPGESSARGDWSGHIDHHPRRGAVLVLAAVVLIVLFAMTAFSIDIGYIAYTKSQLQNAVDAAALAGAQALPDGPTVSRQAARDVAGSNAAAGQAVQVLPDDVELGRWSDLTRTFTVLNGSEQPTANAVRVTGRLTRDRERQLRLFFAPLIGTDETEVQTEAIALLEISQCGRIVGLERVDLENGDVDSYDSASGPHGEGNRGEEGHVCSNGPIVLDPNSSIRGNALPGEGYTVNRPDLVTGTTQPLRRPIDAPPVDGSDVQLNNDNELLALAGLGSGESINLSGNSSVDLPPGTYYIEGDLTVSGLAALNVTGPTEIYVTGSIDITGQGLMNGSRPRDLKLFSSGTAIRIAGNGAFHGVVYAPLAAVDIGGNGDFCGAVLGRTLRLSGNPAAVHYDESLEPVMPEFVRPVLVQ